jgi:hypothetical protein
MKQINCWLRFAIVISVFALNAEVIRTFGTDTPPKFYAVLVSASVQTSPPEIALTWPADPEAASYTIRRKSPDESRWGAAVSLAGNAASYIDRSAASGQIYHYQLTKTTRRVPAYIGYGYIFAGINAPLVDTRGKIILMVERTYASELASELARLQQDLVGDGWTVLRRDVSRQDSVTSIKQLIKQDYDADPNGVRTVFLLGNVPVPYSGAIAPDGHENHRGAWPADVYYGEMDGPWTDSSVTSTNAERQVGWNIPGDGKFDQSAVPSDVDLEIGRVDLSNMTCYSNKAQPRFEKDLLRQYLNKNHNFRHGLIRAERRALICDNFTDKGEDPIGGSGWRNFAPFFGADNIFEVGWTNYLPTVTSQSYLWTFASGGGTYYYSVGVGSSDDFALQNVRAIFTIFMGSYFGDWNNESNFLRAALGSGDVLTASYSGFPHWFYQHMALGRHIGFSARFSQNNDPRLGLFPPFNAGTREVHSALMGDPTLRMHPVLPPGNLNGALTASGVMLNWAASPDNSLAGYHVYRASSPAGPFTRLTGNSPISATTFTDASGNGTYTFIVRAIKLERSGSGTYFNPSQGVFFTTTVTGSGSNITPLKILKGEFTGLDFQLQITGQSGQRIAIEISENMRDWASLGTQTFRGNTLTFIHPNAAQSGRRFYRARLIP